MSLFNAFILREFFAADPFTMSIGSAGNQPELDCHAPLYHFAINHGLDAIGTMTLASAIDEFLATEMLALKFAIFGGHNKL